MIGFVADFNSQLEMQDHHWVIVALNHQLLKNPSRPALLCSYADFQRHVRGSIRFTHHIGLWQDQPVFLVVLEGDTHSLHDQWSVIHLRTQLGMVNDDEFAVAGRALQLAHWLENHQYCGRCGSPTLLQAQERVLVCARCETPFYPRVAPCVIGVIQRGEQCLLARNARFPEGLFSLLAGFIEPGETAEQAFAREVKEEVSIDIAGIEYVASQSWPFPSQLMLGFRAVHAGGDICVDGVEIVEADWFYPDRLPTIPPAHTLSGQLIRRFCRPQSS